MTEPFDEEAAKAEIRAYKVAVAAFEQALRAELGNDMSRRLAGYKLKHNTVWYLEDGKAVSVLIEINITDLSGI